jgi:ferredoxin-type protein NapH
MTQKYDGRRFLQPTTLRKIVAGLAVLIVFISIIFHTGWGTLSSLGWQSIVALCPLGALESMLGARAIIPHVLLLLAVMLIIVLLFGKSFCSWICPVPFVSRFFATKDVRLQEREERLEASQLALDNYRLEQKGEHCGACHSKRLPVDTRHFILLGALGSTAFFGFPVFCIVCPIGLIFATGIAVVRLIGFNEPSLSLLIFPTILLIEVMVLRKWCLKICPMSALLSLVSTFNKTFKPQVDADKCLRSNLDEACAVCSSVCPERIDPHSDLGLRPTTECTRCNRCAQACPQGAISFPLLPKKLDTKKR